MGYPLIGNPAPQFFDSNGDPLAAGTLAVLDPADDTNKNSYPTADDADAASNANSNPITLDANGRVVGLFGQDNEDYKLVLKDASGATIWTVTDVFAPGRISSKGLDYTHSSTGGAARTLQSRLDEKFSVKDFGARGDGSTDDRTAIQAAIDAAEAAGGGVVYFPAGTYIISNFIKVDDTGVMLEGVGGYLSNIFHGSDASQIAAIGSVIKLTNGASLSAHPTNGSDYPIVWFQGRDSSDSGMRWGGGMKNIAIWGNRVRTGATDPDDSGATANNSNGIGLYLEGVRNAWFSGVLTAHCANAGIKTVTGTVAPSKSFGGSWFTDCASHANKEEGLRYVGGDCSFIGFSAGYNGASGMYLVGGKTVSACRTWDNKGDGVLVGVGDIAITNHNSYDNDEAGIKIGAGTFERLLLNDIIVQDNGKDTSVTDKERSGIFVNGTVSGIISNVLAGNKQESGTAAQQYPVYIDKTDCNIQLANIQSNGVPINAQDETSYNGSPGTEGSFAGGASHAASNVITMERGFSVTVDAVSGGAVTEFTVSNSNCEGPVRAGETVVQTSTTGSGTGFEITFGTDNVHAHGTSDEVLNNSFPKEHTINGGVIQLTVQDPVAVITVYTEADASTDDLVTINGGYNGQVLIIAAANGARTIVVKDSTGNIETSGDITLDNAEDTCMLVKMAAGWLALSSSNNGT